MPTNMLDLSVAELKARPEPIPPLDALSPVSQAMLLLNVAEHIARKAGGGVQALAAREMLAAALRLDADARTGLDA